MTFEEYRQQLTDNLVVIQGVGDFVYPNLHWFLSRYGGRMLSKLVRIIEIIRDIDNQTLAAEPSMWMVFLSTRRLAERGQDIAKDHKGWWKAIIQFVALGLLYRHIPMRNDMENKYMADSLKRKRPGQRPVSYYGVPQYTPVRLLAADRQALKMRNSKASASSLTKASVIQIWGVRTANMIYQDSRTATGLQSEIAEALIATARDLIQMQGYVTKESLLMETAKYLYRQNPDTVSTTINYHREVRRLYGQLGVSILKDDGIEYRCPTQQDIENYHLTSRQWIYV